MKNDRAGSNSNHKEKLSKMLQMVNGRYKGGFDDTDCELGQAFNIAIKALEEVQQYRAIGTPEECLRNKDFLRFLANSMNQKKYETYLGIYNAVEKDGRDEE